MFKNISPLARGILKRKNNRDPVHFTADASRTIHSANQLGIYGAVVGWCDEFGLKLDEVSQGLRRQKVSKERKK